MPKSSSAWPDGLGPLAWEQWYAEQQKRPVRQLCPACGDQKFILTDDIDRGGHLAPCPLCSGGDRTRWLAQNCGLEPRERTLGLDDYHTVIAWGKGINAETAKIYNEQRATTRQVIEAFVKRRRGIITLWGDYGSGKSHALYVIVAECLRAGVESLYATTTGILDHLRSLYALGKAQQHNTDPDRYWRRLLNIPVLCLDEVDRFNATEWADAQFFALIDTRYRRRDSHLTVFATNSDPRVENVKYAYWASRVQEFTLVRLQGDVRKIKG